MSRFCLGTFDNLGKIIQEAKTLCTKESLLQQSYDKTLTLNSITHSQEPSDLLYNLITF